MIYLPRVFLISLGMVFVFSQDGRGESFQLGHNIAITTETPKEGTISLGSYAAIYSPTDRLLVGTSTWMMWGYNSYNFVTRYRWDTEKALISNWAAQLVYLKSGEFGEDYYRQEVGMAWLSAKIPVNPFYQMYVTGQYMYFWDETIPFSLRREPFNDDKYQISISTLHALVFTDRWTMNLEFGVLGLKSKYPQTHSGFSIVYQKPSYLVQLGFTVTATPYNLERLFENSSTANPSVDYYDSSVHPEVQLQWFF